MKTEEVLKHLEMKRKYDNQWIIFKDEITLNVRLIIEKPVLEFIKDDPADVVLDFSNTNYLYSTAISMLVSIFKKLNAGGRNLYLVNCSENVRKVLSDSKLDKLFNVYSTDTEFSVNNEKVWKKIESEETAGLMFIPKIENEICRIVISGSITALEDLSDLENYKPEDTTEKYLIDLRNLEYIDSKGAYVFFDFVKRIADKGGYVYLFGIKEDILNIFEILKFVDWFNICETEEEAMRSSEMQGSGN